MDKTKQHDLEVPTSIQSEEVIIASIQSQAVDAEVCVNILHILTFSWTTVFIDFCTHCWNDLWVISKRKFFTSNNSRFIFFT